MDFRILGPLEVLDEGGEVALAGPRQRALLALLLLHANETVSTERLIDDLWDDSPPATAAKAAQVHVSRLRRALGGGDLIETRERGYRLRVDPDRIDARRFERLLTAAREALAGDRPEEAAATAAEALALWRGEPLAGLAHERFAQAEAARLDDLRIAACELEIEARLALGGHAEVVGRLEALIGEHPYRERLRAQLMLALYRCDRQADALQAYQDARKTLVEELGIEPGERLRELEASILAQDPSLALAGREPARAPPEEEVAPPAERPAPPAGRRLVTILFADLVGSTGLGERLDPESMHALLDRVADLCGAAIERHGGCVEGFIGDAVVGVFGLDRLHEDDALRAVRAAVEICDAVPDLSAELEREHGIGIALRLGVESGEVFVSGGVRRASFAAGDAFNVAARLQGIAAPGEIVLGESVHRLVGAAARAEPLGEALELRGRSAPVHAWRLVELREPVADRPVTREFVDREDELAELRTAFERARELRSCEPVTIVGPAGIGKSRLVRELVAGLGGEAVVAVGRCQSYGEGTTYEPVAEIVRQLGGAEALAAGDEEAARLVPGATADTSRPAQPEEVFWAVRRLIERAAADRPLIGVFEDVHWAEPTLLDLIDYVTAFSSGSPVLLIATARPDLVETRPAWLAPRDDRTLVALGPLPDAHARRLVGDAEAADRIVEAAEGNPLFLEQLAAMDPGDEEATLPSTIQAVLAARIDGLDPGPRAVLGTASVQGRAFHAAPLARQLDDERVRSHLVALVRDGFIRPARSEPPGEDAFRFAHALIREAAYKGLPRRRRAELHRQTADWLDGLPGDRDEPVGNHLAAAHRELAAIGSADAELAAEAGARLARAAGAAMLRGDPPGGARLLERATELMPAAERVALLPRLGAALLEAGRLTDAEAVLDEALEAAAGDRALEARASVERELVRLQASASSAGGTRVADDALAALEADGDLLGQCRALCLRARNDWVAGRASAADDAWERAAELAERAGDEAALFEILDWRASAALFGPAPVADAIGRCERIRERLRGNPVAAARTLPALAALHAMAGGFAEARLLLAGGDEILRDVGGLQSAVAQPEAIVELLAGDPVAAEARLRPGYERLAAMGERALLADTATMLARTLFEQGRLEEASAFCRVGEGAAADDDLSAQVGWRSLRARLLAARGHAAEAAELAAEAVALSEPTDFLGMRAGALLDLGEVLRAGGRDDEARATMQASLDLHEAKGDAVSGERVRARLGAPSLP